jgi:cephalosporin hydroxylase
MAVNTTVGQKAATHKLEIDLDEGRVRAVTSGGTHDYELNSPEAFHAISQAWLRSGWQNKHVYTFTWMGRPVIQLPEDLLRIQEVLYRLQPDVIVETGIAHGGSLVFYASLCKAMGKGRVIGADIEIRPQNRAELENHELFGYMQLIEGDSISPDVVEQFKSQIRSDETVFVMLDGKHTQQHVREELELYSPLVTVGSYIVAADGIMQNLAGLKRYQDDRTNDDWQWNNPQAAARDFVADNPDFVIETPELVFNESPLTEPITYCENGWIKRIN